MEIVGDGSRGVTGSKLRRFPEMANDKMEQAVFNSLVFLHFFLQDSFSFALYTHIHKQNSGSPGEMKKPRAFRFLQEEMNMKNYKRKMAAAGLTLALFLGGQAGLSAMTADAASLEATPQTEAFQRDMESLAPQNRYDYVYVLRVVGPMGESLSEGMVSYRTSPDFLAKGNMKTSTNGKLSHMQFYSKETGKGLVNYVQANDGKWTETRSNGPVDLSLLKNDLPKTLGGQMIASAREVTLLSSAKGQDNYRVTVDGGRFLKAIPQFKEQAFGSSAGQMMDMLDRIGDVPLFVTVDTENHRLTALKADLSQPIKNAVDAAASAGSINPIQAAAMKAMAGSLQVQLEVASVDQKASGTIEIPETVARNAVKQ